MSAGNQTTHIAPPPPPPPPSNGFISIIQDFRNGQSLDELTEEFQKLVAAVRETGKGGSISYTVKVAPASKGVGLAVTVDDKITSKIPEIDREKGIFFVNENNLLQRENPNQRQFDLKVVEGAKPAAEQPLKKVAGA